MIIIMMMIIIIMIIFNGIEKDSINKNGGRLQLSQKLLKESLVCQLPVA